MKVTGDDWSWKFEGLPKYKDKGISIEYTITEDAVEGYNCEITGFHISNHHIPAKTSVEVSKVWDDAEDQDGKRPQSVTIQLLEDGEHTGMILVLNADNEWKGFFHELDAYKNGKKVEYTVKEEAVKDYSTTITGDAEKGFTVINSHTPEPPTEPSSEAPTEPSSEAPTEPTTEPTTEPATEPAAEPTTEPEEDDTDPAIPPDEFGSINPEDPSNGTRVDDEAQGTTAETEVETEAETGADTEVETQLSVTNTMAETTATLPTRAPDTGDGFSMGLYLCLFTMSALTSGGLWMIRRKKEE